ncbi:MAG: hypothetical protein H6937_09045 [Burkholderiales bacterium]|nr:hypothetical protein [Burkholderiales bacterium]MDR4518970.1 hypothetical protein [Nitrosomonas sp.]
MAEQVKAYVPIEITDARFISSTIAEPDAAEPNWNTTTVFAQGDLASVITTDSHLVYESLQASNQNHPPATSPTWWILKGFTNQRRMFDWKRGQKSTGTSPMIVSVRPGKRINAITLEGIRASHASITVQDGIGGATVLTIDKSLLARHAVTPFQWCFGPWVYDKVLCTFEVPPVIDPVVTVTLTDSSGTCDLSRFATGLAVDLGEIEWDSSLEDENNSAVVRNEFNEAEFNPVPDIPILESPIEIAANRINLARQFKADSNGKVIIFSGMDSIDSFREMHTIVGFFRRFKLATKNHKLAKFDIRVEGL